MPIRKFKVTAIRTDEYEIEIDDEIYNEEWRVRFASYMYELDGLKDIAQSLASHQLRLGDDFRFIEGFGNVLRNGKMPFSRNDFDAAGQWLPEDKREQPAIGLNIRKIDEDDQHEFEIEEVPNAEA